MNILISNSWLREHLKTKATPEEIAEYLSLSSQSVEKVTKVENDWVYEIEVTTNRPDCLSLYGIARELTAILPRFGIPAHLNSPPTTNDQGPTTKTGLSLDIKITDSSLCPRFTAIIFDNVKIGPSPKIVQERLEKSGVRALNNVVDISNYLMLEIGQPMHTFDYDKIKGAKMTLREAEKGEKITTLDGQKWNLPEGAIVIEDGEGRLIDLCGIMGGENSAVDEKTRRVLLFVQTYDPSKIRRTCQILRFRSEAASRFEKGVDPEGVIVALKKAIEIFRRNCVAKIAGKLIDIYPNPPKRKIIKLDLNLVKKIIGLDISKDEVIAILKSLGFSVLSVKFSVFSVSVPHWRHNDISIPEDLVEEIARIYGYHRLPSNLPPTSIPGIERPKFRELRFSDPRFFWEERIKTALKYWGLTEVASYSMVGEDLLAKGGFTPANYLKIANPLTTDLLYMRPSLIPSLLEIISQNQVRLDQNQTNYPDIEIFEMANIYIPQGEKDLPDEIPMLTAGLTGDKFLEGKGILEALFKDLGIKDYQFRIPTSPIKIFHPEKVAEIFLFGSPIGAIGQIDPALARRLQTVSPITVFDLEVKSLVRHATRTKKYTPIPTYPPIIEDLAFLVPEKTLIGEMMEEIKGVDRLIAKVELLDSFKDNRTFRTTYQDSKKTLTDKEIRGIREKIIKKLKAKFKAELKSN